MHVPGFNTCLPEVHKVKKTRNSVLGFSRESDAMSSFVNRYLYLYDIRPVYFYIHIKPSVHSCS